MQKEKLGGSLARASTSPSGISAFLMPRNEGGPGSDRHDFSFLVGEMLVDLCDVLIGELLNLFFRILDLIFCDAAFFAGFLESFHGVATDVADGHAAILGHFTNDLYKFIAAFRAQLGEDNADELFIDGGVEAEVGFEDRF